MQAGVADTDGVNVSQLHEAEKAGVSLVNNSLSQAKEYTDSMGVSISESNKKYTDAAIAKIKPGVTHQDVTNVVNNVFKDVNNGDAKTLAEANQHSDANDAKTLNAAKQYTDNTFIENKAVMEHNRTELENHIK
ncbi:hypothetical protein [Photobacterium leiognathi]|uniref:hypothetical protein n=1 Tax=Photobacterium leiognathi TaxID=553611 RepID=UPI002739087D|nr:hypothetical protein [Photobacterium leiognathi]